MADFASILTGGLDSALGYLFYHEDEIRRTVGPYIRPAASTLLDIVSSFDRNPYKLVKKYGKRKILQGLRALAREKKKPTPRMRSIAKKQVGSKKRMAGQKKKRGYSKKRRTSKYKKNEKIVQKANVRYRSVKGRRRKRSVKTLSAKVKRLSKAVAKLQKSDSNDMGTLMYKVFQHNYIAANPGIEKWYNRRVFRPSDLNTWISECEYIKADGTLGPRALSTVSTEKFFFSKFYHQIELFNPSNAPIIVNFYWLRPKTDLSNAPLETMINGVNEKLINGQAAMSVYNANSSTYTQPELIYPTLSDDFNHYWDIHKKSQVELGPLQRRKIVTQFPGFTYVKDVSDESGELYQKGTTAIWMLSLSGKWTANYNASDVIQTSGQNTAAEVIVQSRLSFSIKYNAGVNVKQFFVDDERTIPAAGGNTKVAMDNVVHNVATIQAQPTYNYGA